MNSEIFNYNKNFFSGTEQMASYFHKNVLPQKINFNNYQCYIIPGPLPFVRQMVEDKRDIILWFHIHLGQLVWRNFKESADYLFELNDVRFLNKIKYVVVVSETHKKIMEKELNIESEKIIVIPNFLDPINKNKDKFNKTDKIKVIYTSAPDRSLKIIAESLKYIKDDFEMNIFSDILPDVHLEDPHVRTLSNDSRITFFGQTPKKVVHKYLENSHIWVHPLDFFQETFCISLVEALSAECLAIYPNYSALPEVANGFGMQYEHHKLSEMHAKIFAENLSKGILKIKNKEFDPKDQAEIINQKYSKKNFEQNWQTLYDSL
jgi:glycosyltransferase involved in cell wall biosynthesis